MNCDNCGKHLCDNQVNKCTGANCKSGCFIYYGDDITAELADSIFLCRDCHDKLKNKPIPDNIMQKVIARRI